MSEESLNLECWVDELSPAQLAAYKKVGTEHTAVKNALKSALTTKECKKLCHGKVFQAYAFKGKVLKELMEASKPQKTNKPTRTARKRSANFDNPESDDKSIEHGPKVKRIAAAAGSSKEPLAVAAPKPSWKRKWVQFTPAVDSQNGKKNEMRVVRALPAKFFPSELKAVGGLVVGNVAKGVVQRRYKHKGTMYPTLLTLAKPALEVNPTVATCYELDSKVKLVLRMPPNEFIEWLIQQGLVKTEQKCAKHGATGMKLATYSIVSTFPYSGGYVWLCEFCSKRLVSVFKGSIFEQAPHTPSCIFTLIYYWSCQTPIQNVERWVEADNLYVSGVYTWLRAVCTLTVQQERKQLGGADKFVEVGLVTLCEISEAGQREVRMEVLGVFDSSDKTVRLHAFQPAAASDRNARKRWQTLLAPLQRWVHKDSMLSIDLSVDKMALHAMGFTNIVQTAEADTTVMWYLQNVVPDMFKTTFSLLSLNIVQQFLDELVWREQFGKDPLQAFDNITRHIADQTRMNTLGTLTKRLYQAACNPFKDWSN